MKKYKLFIDCDDVIVMSSPLIQKDVENNTRFKSSELISRERLLKMLRYFQKKINDKNISLEELAMLKESLKYEMNANDVIRVEQGDVSITSAIQTLCSLAEHDKEMFLEERDAYLERDNKNLEGGAVDYDSIYRKENMAPCNSVFLKWLYDTELFSDIYEITSQNGPREDNAKANLNKKEFPFIHYLSLRFHNTEHVDGIRRGRSSKAEYTMRTLNIPDLADCVLIDDSTANVTDWMNYNGIGLLYKPLSLLERKEKRFDNLYIDPNTGRRFVRIFSLNALEVQNAIENYDEILNSKQKKIS